MRRLSINIKVRSALAVAVAKSAKAEGLFYIMAL